MLHLITRQLTLAIFATLFFHNCASTIGEIVDNEYLAPSGEFTCNVPKLQGLKVRDSYNPNDGSVSFESDEGNLYSIIYWRLQPKASQMTADPVSRLPFYLSFFREYIMPNMFYSLSPDIRTLHQEILTLDEQQLVFAVLEMNQAYRFLDPNQSDIQLETVEDDGEQEGEQYIIRSVAVFHHDEYMYLLSDQYTYTRFEARNWNPPSPQALKSRINSITRFWERIAFND
ncbi:hypothetical protein ACFL5M_00570 [Candidatus Neomarinimicrobiota bacterium]